MEYEDQDEDYYLDQEEREPEQIPADVPANPLEGLQSAPEKQEEKPKPFAGDF